MQLLNSPSNVASGIEKTWWAAYNAITEYTDHFKTVRKASQDPTRVLDSITLGSGAKMKIKAFDLALSMSGIRES